MRDGWLSDTEKDLRFALRLFRRAPLRTAAAIITIALAIGANTAIFSAVNAVILRPLPYPHPEQLYLLAEENPERGWHRGMVSTANYLDWRDGVTAFENIAAYDYSATSETLSGLGDSRRIHVVEATGNLFATLGARVQIGRTLEDAETWKSAPATLVLSDAMWTREFGRDPSVIGRRITLDGESYQIVGVMPRSFSFPYEQVDGWVSFRWDPSVRSKEMWRRERWLRVVGRLRAGASPTLASAQLEAVASRLAHDFPVTNTRAGASITPLHDYLVRDVRTPLLVLLGAVAVLLLIACANVANLLLVQASERQREIVLRLALGANRRRLVRQSMTESLLLSAIGAICGLALGWSGARILLRLLPSGLLHIESFGIDAEVAFLVALVAGATGLLFGVAPLLWIQRRNAAEVLKETARSGTASRGSRRFADLLAVAEVGLALLMSVGAALLVGSARRLASVDPGFDSRGVLMTGYALYSHAYDSATHRQTFHDEVLTRVRRLPGVTHAAFGSTPLEPNLFRSGVVIHGRPSPPSVEPARMYGSPDWLATLGIPLRAGRFYTDDDRRDESRIVVNETFARMFFPGEDPIGQHIAFTKREYGPPLYTIIGVIGDVRETSLMEPPGPVVVDQFTAFGAPTLLVRSQGDPTAITAELRRIVRDMDPQITLGRVQPLDVLRDEEMARTRFFASLLFGFAAIGLLLAAVWLYGVLAQLARGRAREMGIRIALGARPAQVQWIVARHAAVIVGLGIVAGTAVALMATRVLASLLFGLAPDDPIVFAVAVVLLVITGAIAAYVPAWRASTVDPMQVLRSE